MSKIRFTKTTAPATPPTNTSSVYVDTIDDHLKRKKDDGSVIDYDLGNPESIEDIVAVMIIPGNAIDTIYNDPAGQLTISVDEADIDHGALSGLGDNDHTQYLLRDGTSPMTGALNMGTNAISNASTYNSVTVETHAARHLPSGADPITTATAITIGTANSTGTANSLARSDHGHSHGAQTDPAQHAIATVSANGFMLSADKIKLDGISGTRIIKSGTVTGATFVGAPRIATVTFSTAFPNTNYSILIMGANSRAWSFQTKLAGSFVINSNANGALAGEVTWTCISYGESVE